MEIKVGSSISFGTLAWIILMILAFTGTYFFPGYSATSGILFTIFMTWVWGVVLSFAWGLFWLGVGVIFAIIFG
jgi:hypothetical protein